MSARPRRPPSENSLSPPLKPPASPTRRFWLATIAGLSFGLLLAAFSTEITDSDFWWHLRTGQYIVQTHKLPDPDPFAYTTAIAGAAYPGEDVVRSFNLTHEWLFQVYLYLIHAAGGFAGVVLCRALILSLLCGLVGLVAYRRSGGFYRAILAALACASVATIYATDRPFGLSFLLLALVIVILDSGRFVPFLPALFLLWANLHGGFFVGWTVLGAYSAEALVSRLRQKPQPTDVRLWVVSGLSIAASALNPNVFDALRVVTLYKQSILQSRVWEWQPTKLLPLTPFSLIFLAALGTMIWANRKARLSDWILFAAFSLASLIAVRNVLLIGILGPILAVTYLPAPRFRMPALAHWGAAVLLVAGIGAEVAQGRSFQFTANLWKYPSGAAKFIEDHGIKERMFNDYTDGGFLIWRLWPLERVFIDGRALSDKIYQDFASIETNSAGRGSELLAQYHIGIIVTSGFEYTAGTLYEIVPELSGANQTEWKLVYLDQVSSVFMKTPPPGVTPIRLPYPLAGVEAQCRYHVDHNPSTPLCAKALAYRFVALNDAPHAREWFAYYLDHKTVDDPQAATAYGNILRYRPR